MQRRQFLKNKKIGEDVIDNKIYYITSDYNIIRLENDKFNENITLNTRNGDKNVIVFDNSVTSIGSRAFYDCSSLTDITIPESVTSIGYYAFRECSSLTTINIPSSVMSIGYMAFFGCSNLTDIYIPESVTSIGEWAFYGCSSLTTINIPENSQLTSIGNYAFYGCSSLASINIPESVTSIGELAFSSCSSLTTISVAEGNTIYDSRGGCNAIIETNSNTLIAGCSTTIIPEGVTSIGYRAFYGCTSLTTINIHEGVTSIGKDAFYYCSSLSSITCHAITPPSVSTNTFFMVNNSIPVYVPAESVDAYKAATGWKNFTNIQANLITFTIAGAEYQAEEGMTWEEWVDSEYNTGGFIKYQPTFLGHIDVIFINDHYIYNINITDVIQSNNYILHAIPNSGGAD